MPPARGRHGCSLVKWEFVKAARGLRAAAPGSVAARDIVSTWREHTWAREDHVRRPAAARHEPDADERPDGHS